MKLESMTTWMDNAPCIGRGDIFFPEEETAESIIPARELCATCPHRWACVDASLDEEFGVWGGLAVWQRRPLRLALNEGFAKIEPMVGKVVAPLFLDGRFGWIL